MRTFVRRDDRASAWTGLALALLTPLSLGAPLPVPVRLVVVLAFATLAPGAAVVCWLDGLDPVVRAALAMVISLAVFSGVAATMAWLGAWHPTLGVCVIAAVCGSVCAVRIGTGTPAAGPNWDGMAGR